MLQKIFSAVVIFFVYLTVSAQSTDDIRFTFGEGPFPVYVTASAGMTGTKHLFSSFVNDYNKKNDLDIKNTTLYSWEINLGAVINCRHCLAIKGIHIRGWAVEYGHMNAARKLPISGGHHLTLVESTSSLRAIVRYSKLYPITMQFHAGINAYSFYQIRDVITTDTSSVAERFRGGSSFFENHQGHFHKLFPGYNFRFRLCLIDPTGVGSGTGFFAEYSYVGKWRHDNFKNAYKFFGLNPQKADQIRRNFGRLSLGLVVPLAQRMY